MKVAFSQTRYNRNYNASFKGVDLVKLSKQGITYAEDLVRVGKNFDEAVFKIPGTKDKVNTIMEFPAFAMLARYCKEKRLSMPDLLETWKISLPKPSEDSFLFHVLSGDDMTRVADMFKGSNGAKLQKELSAQVMTRRSELYGINMFKIFNSKDLGMHTNAKIAETITNSLPKPTNIFEINSLYEIPKIFEKINF